MKNSGRGIALLITVPFILLCAGGTGLPQEAHSFIVIEEDGIPTAVTSGGPRFQGELFEFEEVLTLDLENLRKRHRIEKPVAFVSGPDGHFYVADGDRFRIAVFDERGGFVRSFGDEGDRPGEFYQLVIQAVRGDTIEVFDGENDRVTRFRTDGTLVDTLTVERYRFPWKERPKRGFRDPWEEQAEEEEWHKTQVTYPIAACRLPGDRLVVLEVSEWPRASALARATVYSSGGDTVAAVGTGGVRTGTWAYYSRRPERTMQRPEGQMGRPGFQPRNIRFKQTVRLPFAPLPSALYRENQGILLSSGDEPVLSWYRPNGEFEARVRINMKPGPVTDDDKESFEHDYQEWISELDLSRRSEAEGKKRFLLLPDTKAFWTHVYVDDAGFYWLRTPGGYIWEDGNQRFTYWILSPEGEFLGLTEAPETFYSSESWQEYVTPVSVSSGHFMAITKSAYSEEFNLKVYRIRPAVSGLVYP